MGLNTAAHTAIVSSIAELVWGHEKGSDRSQSHCGGAWSVSGWELMPVVAQFLSCQELVVDGWYKSQQLSLAAISGCWLEAHVCCIAWYAEQPTCCYVEQGTVLIKLTVCCCGVMNPRNFILPLCHLLVLFVVSGRGERLGLGAHNPAGSAAALGDVYSSYRRLRSTSYHEMIVGGKGVSNMAKGG